MRELSILIISLLHLPLLASYDILVVHNTSDFDCDGSIEVVTGDDFSPYSILFDNGMSGSITSGSLSFLFEDICAGIYSATVINGMGCESRIENIEVLDSGVEESGCVSQIKLKVFLEGAYNVATGDMTRVLNKDGYLPGQTPLSSLYVPTPISLAYTHEPWGYRGSFSSVSLALSNEIYTPDIVDWLLIGFRTNISPKSIILREVALLNKDGQIIFPSGCSALNQVPVPKSGLYVVVEHRNHMAVMTPNKIKFDDTNSASYDFSIQDSYVEQVSFGQKLMSNGTWVMYSGDVDQISDDFASDINGIDKISWQNSNGLFGLYHAADTNLDADINGADKILWKNNNGISNRVQKIK